MNPGNAGMPRYVDLIIPAVFILLLVINAVSIKGIKETDSL